MNLELVELLENADDYLTSTLYDAVPLANGIIHTLCALGGHFTEEDAINWQNTRPDQDNCRRMIAKALKVEYAKGVKR